MPFAADDSTNTTQIPPAGNHAQIARIKSDGVQNLARSNIQVDGIVDLYKRVGVTNSPAIMCYQERDPFGTSLHTPHFAQFILQT